VHINYEEVRSMARPTSFRLPEELLDRLEEEGRSSGMSITALVASLLDEGLNTRRFPGVVYRDGPAGRRAGLVGGPDIWEVARDLGKAPGRGMRRLEHLAAETGIPVSRLRLAVDFYAAFPEEIERLIEADAQAARRARRSIDERERLLSR
jgi:hypothetical protein